MYDEIVKNIHLTADEMEIILQALYVLKENAICLGEIQTYESLIEKLI